MYGRFLKNEKGSAFLMAVIGMGVLSVITLGAIFMGSTNEKQTHREGKRTQAYYVADVGAKTIMKELDGLSGKPLKDKLDEMKGKGVMKGTYTDDTTSSSANKWDFEIQVVETSENVYELRSTGIANDIKDGTRVILTLEEAGGGGYKIGDGKIFINSNEKLELAYLPQISGAGSAGMSIYTKAELKEDLANRPIMITQEPFKNLFLSRNDRGGKSDEDLNKDFESAGKGLGNYNLIIRERDKKHPKNIKREIIERVKSERTDADNRVEFVYNMQNHEIMEYFSYGKLPSDTKLSNESLEEAISGIFLLPVRDVKEYEKYIGSNDIFPAVTFPKLTKADKTSLASSKYQQFESTEIVDLTDSNEVEMKNRLVIAEKGNLTLKTSGDTDIILNGGLEMSKGSKLTIVADGTVNFYIKGHAQPDGNINVEKPKGNTNQVNFYLDPGAKFQNNNTSEIIGVNLYAPNNVVQLQNNVVWEGVIVGQKVQFKDNATFRAPSSGSSASDMNKEWTIKGKEWKEWQVKK